MNELNTTTSMTPTIALLGLMSAMTTANAVESVEFKIEQYTNEFASRSGAFIDVHLKETINASLPEVLLSKLTLKECPKYIKSTFGLNITDLAKILSVSRPTAYKYVDGDIPHGDNSELIEKLYELASYWESKAEGIQLGMEFKRKYGEKSLYEHMMAKEFSLAKNLIDEISIIVNSRKSKAHENEGDTKHGVFNPDMTRTTVIS